MDRAFIDDWQRRIRAAPTPDGLLELVREFLGLLAPEQVGRLPPSSRPNGVRDIDELAAFNVQVAKDELMFEGDAATRALLRRMTTVLTEATNRGAQFSFEGRTLNPPRE